MSLRRALKSSVAAVCIACLAMPAGVAAQSAPAARARAGGLEVRVAQSKDFSRIEFRGGRPSIRREGQVLVLTFPRDGDPDMSRLRVSPPRWVKTAEARHGGGRLELRITLAEDADFRSGFDDGAAFINVFEKPPEAETPAAAQTAEAEPAPTPAPSPPPVRPNPIPAGGVVSMGAKLATGQVQLSFPWANPNGAAVFRRGEAVWVVFDAPATLDVSRAPRGLRQYRGMTAYKGADYSAVRIQAPPNMPVFASNDGSTWTITLGAGAGGQQGAIKVSRSDGGGPAGLTAAVAGVTRVVRVADPVVGDSLTVATALAPAKGLRSRREFVQMALLQSAQGLAMEPYAEDVDMTFDGDLVSIGRSAGLALSPQAAFAQRQATEPGAPQPASLPGLIDYENWSKTGSGGFMARYGALTTAAGEELGKGVDAPTAARMALARFLVGSDLSFEAIGVLNALSKQNPRAMNDPEFRGLRGIARVMARRYQEAATDFSAPVLADDPASSLWRSYIASKTNQWAEGRQQFADGAEAFSRLPPVWRARIAAADAESALALGDLQGAEGRIKLALNNKIEPREQLSVRLIQARMLEAMGKTDWALHIYKAVSRSTADYLQAPALLRATTLEYQRGKISPSQAAAVYDGLRYRWRGDTTELETIRALGQLYLGQGRYREALEALRTAGQRLPNLPQAAALQQDLTAAFRGLFLDGLADGLEPIQALAMFYDFKDLTPVGADGDMMVRKLVRRLVDVDLLPQAADLLAYQVDNRLDGIPRAQVASDLALIYLMDRQPEKAIQAINGSRSTVLPTALNAERRLIEARAWLALNRGDHAVEVLGKDASAEAQELRADAAWKGKDWGGAGALFEKGLGDRWKRQDPLTIDEEARLLRAGVSYSLAGDEAALNRLQQRYQGFYAQARNPEALKVALTGVSTERLSVSDFGRSVADADAFSGWVAKAKQKFREKPAPAAPAASAKAAAAAPKPAAPRPVAPKPAAPKTAAAPAKAPAKAA